MKRILFPLLLLAACSPDHPTGPPLPPPGDEIRILVVSGENQEARIQEELPLPLLFRVVDEEGDPVAGETVFFEMENGEAVFDPPSTPSSADGLVETRVTLGTVAGDLWVLPGIDSDLFSGAESLLLIALPGDAANLQWIFGSGQKDAPSATLQETLLMGVFDEWGNGVPGVSVGVTAPGGSSVTPASGISDDEGQCSFVWTLGGDLGDYELLASSAGIATAQATAIADLPPHVNDYSPPGPLGPGDFLNVYGENFCLEPEFNTLRLGGRDLDIVSATETQLRSRLPDDMAMGWYELTLSVGSQSANASLDSLAVAPGYGVVTDLGLVEGELPLSLLLDGGESDYLFLVYSLKESGPYELLPYSAGPDRETETRAQDRSLSPVDLFHQRLLMARGSRPGNPPAVSPRSSPVSVRDFQVLSDAFGNIYSPSDYETVQATLRYSGSQALLYVDSRDDSSLPQASVDELGLLFDTLIHPQDTASFGEESDIDSNGKVMILLSRVVNAMTTWSDGSYVGGFFNPVDLDVWSSPSGCSNHGEVFFAIVPDPVGEFSPVPHSLSSTLSSLPPILAHEFQHMINMGQRHIVHGNYQTPQEELWLNEGLSHLAENLCGFDEQNQSRVSLYLHSRAHRNWALASLDGAATVGNSLAERGASYLFCRYLEDRWPGSVRNLVQSVLPGRENVTSACEEDFEQVFKDWIAAIYLDDREGEDSDPRYQFSSHNLRLDFPYSNQDEPLAIPLNSGSMSSSLMPMSFDLQGLETGAAPGILEMLVEAPSASRIGLLLLRTRL
ncbi:MAG: hypothetical protein QGG80_05590 [Candidatus Krumholzibacteria bacterium]|nr:hypothetical protein [Candidatus Krumholzibacteria bacterium]MDP7021010.1 hypothetical protein [Candidatus Krumholzibacteria bacterium]